MKPNRPENPSGTGHAEKRAPHSIRFLDPEWERIAAFAGDRGLAPAEFVRFAALAAIENEDGASVDRLAPLIETTFRLTYILGTRKRDEMVEAGEREALQSLIAEARERQDEILGGGSD